MGEGQVKETRAWKNKISGELQLDTKAGWINRGQDYRDLSWYHQKNELHSIESKAKLKNHKQETDKMRITFQHQYQGRMWTEWTEPEGGAKLGGDGPEILRF